MEKRVQRPIFIVGFPRTGTTLLRCSLGQHPELFALLVEVHYVKDFYERYGLHIGNASKAAAELLVHPKFPSEFVSDAMVRETFPDAGDISFVEFFRRYFSLLQQGHPSQRLVLKYPAMVFSLDVVAAIFPDAYIVNMIRDPRAAICSHQSRWPRKKVWWCANWWCESLRVARNWTNQHPEVCYIDIRYEDLIAEPENTLRMLCSALEIDFHPNLVAVAYEMKDYTKGGGTSKFNGFDASRLDLWRQKLSSLEVRLIEQRCAGEMRRYGYEPSGVVGRGRVRYHLYYLYQMIYHAYYTLGFTVKSVLRQLLSQIKVRLCVEEV